jgi:hypothetical protein
MQGDGAWHPGIMVLNRSFCSSELGLDNNQVRNEMIKSPEYGHLETPLSLD